MEQDGKIMINKWTDIEKELPPFKATVVLFLKNEGLAYVASGYLDVVNEDGFNILIPYSECIKKGMYYQKNHECDLKITHWKYLSEDSPSNTQ